MTDASSLAERGLPVTVDTSSFDNPDSPPIPAWRMYVAAISEPLNALRLAPVPDEDLADIVHIVRDLEKQLAAIRREREAEAAELIPKGERLEGNTQGGGLESKPKNTYTFSTARILTDTMNGLGESSTPLQALRFLEQRGAVQIKWLVSKLRPALSSLNVQPSEAPQGIDDDDGEFHIGKVTTWSVGRDS